MWEATYAVILALQQVSCVATAADTLAVAKERGPCALLHTRQIQLMSIGSVRADAKLYSPACACSQPNVDFPDFVAEFVLITVVAHQQQQQFASLKESDWMHSPSF